MAQLALENIVKDLIQDFAVLDANGGGYVDKADLAKVFNKLTSKEWDAKVDALLDVAGMQRNDRRVDYPKFLTWLVQDAMPVKQQSPAKRKAFLDYHWAPYLSQVQEHLESTRRRQSSGFSLHEVLPSHAEIAVLAKECMRLTRQWHGRANVSAFYEIFMEMAELDGHSPYRFQDLPQKRSPDGYIRVLDMQARRRLYKPTAATSTCTEFVGRLTQAAGESAIDNLELPSIMRRRNALLLMVGNRIQQLLVRTVRWKQRRLLAAVGLSVDSESAMIKQRMQDLMHLPLAAQSVAFDFLLQRGVLLESYGQLSDEARDQVDRFISAELGGKCDEALPPKVLGDELEAFLSHCCKHPGRAFKGNAVEHKLMLLRAIASPEIRVLWRSEVEQFTQHRYFSVPWVRKVPLIYLPASSTTAPSKDIGVLRPVGSKEFTRFRKNVFAYGDSHGLGQSGGGWADDWPIGSLMYEFGVLLCVDEAAKVPNHWVTDIEKIVMDCLVLCPAGGTKDALPGEVLHDAGQNPVIASSIGLTQHTQTTHASIADFPLMADRSCPTWVDRFGAWIDIVQVGEHEDAFFISVRSREPDSSPCLQFLVDLRLRFLHEFARSIDFTVTCHATADGEYVVIFSPVACMRKITVPKGEGVLGLDFNFENPELKEVVTNLRLAAATLDCSHGKGNILAQSSAYWDIALDGRPMLMRLYDFNRKLGTRKVAQSFIDDFLR